MKNRYQELGKFITACDDLTIVNSSEVYISSVDNYDIVFDLENRVNEFEKLKPFISLIAMNICKLDNIVQKYNERYCQNSQFDFDLAAVYLDRPDIVRLDYWGMEVNTQFIAYFEYKNNKFVLTGFGREGNIPSNWNKN